MRARPESGMTLIEVLVVASLVGIVLGVPLLALNVSSRSLNTSAASANLNRRARSSVNRVADLLAASGSSVIPQAGGGPGIGTSVVDFQRSDGFAGGAIAWGNPERLVLRSAAKDPDDGIDNDGDGRVDEKRLVWIQDFGSASPVTTVLCDGVADALEGELPGNGVDDNGNGLIDEQGFVLEFDGDQVVVRITLTRFDSVNGLVSRTVERAVALRND